MNWNPHGEHIYYDYKSELAIQDSAQPHDFRAQRYLDVRGEMDSSIAIRTVLIKGGYAHCWGGGGIVADSHWQDEYQESITKVKVLLDTLQTL